MRERRKPPCTLYSKKRWGRLHNQKAAPARLFYQGIFCFFKKGVPARSARHLAQGHLGRNQLAVAAHLYGNRIAYLIGA